MAAVVRKRTNNIARRRRLDDEDESKSVATLADDSQSDVSVPSDVDENGDADNSDLSEVDSAPSLTAGKAKRKANGAQNAKAHSDIGSRREPSPPIARSDTAFPALKETEMMLNGLQLADESKGAEAVDFETSISEADAAPAVGGPGRQETPGERRRREHEEYKKKRDADPAFIPNRGAFFMHDQRSAPAQNGFRPVGGRGRGRGGGGIGGPFSPAKYAPNRTPLKDAACANTNNSIRPQQNEATDSPWQHDLHETVNVSQPVQPPSGPFHHLPTGHQHAARAPQAPTPKRPRISPAYEGTYTVPERTHQAAHSPAKPPPASAP
jgi:hypothetical protein